MHIGLTKKLADYTGITTLPADPSTNPFFTWSANLLTIHRRKTIVCVNDATRFAFILHGIKAVDVKNIDQLLQNEIRRVLVSEGVAPAIVDQYLSDAVGDLKITYTKTASHKTVAALNSACRDLDSIVARNAVEFPSQRQLQILNRFPFRTSKNQIAQPYKLFIMELRNRYGDPVIQTDAAELTVILDPGGSTAVRRLIVPAFYTFEELHNVLQTVFPWENYHLHRFILSQDDYGKPMEIIAPADVERDDEDTHHLESEVRLSEVLQANSWTEDRTIIYHYDFGDDWKHTIKLERIISQYNKSYSQCTLMKGDAPPEDVGGPPGFQYVLDVLQNEEHEDHSNIKSWIRSMSWRPIAEGDIDKVNQRLRERMYGHYWRLRK